MDELKKVIEELGRAFEEYKKINDQRLAEIKGVGASNSNTEAKLQKAEADIDRLSKEREKLQGEIEGMKTAMNRSGFNPESKQANRGDAREMKAAFEKFMRKGEDRMSADEIKALSVDSNVDGGFLVRPELSSRIITKIFETSPIRQLATVEVISSDSLELMVDVDEASASWVAERASRGTTGTPAVKLAKIYAHELMAEPQATQKLLDDASFDVEMWLARKVADKFARSEASAFVSGNGVTQPRGFTTYASGTSYGQIEQVNSGTSGAITADGLISLLYSLKEAYQVNASFLTQRASVAAIRKLKDSQNRYLWEPSLQAGQPETLLGRPLYFAADMASVAANALAVACGDFKAGYQIVDRAGIRVLRDPFSSKPNVQFYTTKRVGGDVVDFDAIKLLKLA